MVRLDRRENLLAPVDRLQKMLHEDRKAQLDFEENSVVPKP